MLRTQTNTTKRCFFKGVLYRKNVSNTTLYKTNLSLLNNRFYAKPSKDSMPFPSFISKEHSGYIKGSGIPFNWNSKEIARLLEYHHLPYKEITPLVNLSLQNSGECVISLKEPKDSYHYLSKNIPIDKKLLDTPKIEDEEEEEEEHEEDGYEEKEEENYKKNQRFNSRRSNQDKKQSSRPLYLRFKTIPAKSASSTFTSNSTFARSDAATSNIVRMSSLPYTGTHHYLTQLTVGYPVRNIDVPHMTPSLSTGEAYITFETQEAAHRFATSNARTEVAKRTVRSRKVTAWERRVVLSLCKCLLDEDPVESITQEIENLNQLPVFSLELLPRRMVEEDIRQKVDSFISGPIKVQIASMDRKHVPDGRAYVMLSSEDDAKAFADRLEKHPIFMDNGGQTRVNRTATTQMLLSCTPIVSILLSARRFIHGLDLSVLGNKLVHKPLFAGGRAIKFTGLPYETNTADVKRLLKDFTYDKDTIVFGTKPGSLTQHNGMCWVSFPSQEEAQRAAETLDGDKDGNHTLNVQFLKRNFREDK